MKKALALIAVGAVVLGRRRLATDSPYIGCTGSNDARVDLVS
jgi:hypothetical protein